MSRVLLPPRKQLKAPETPDLQTLDIVRPHSFANFPAGGGFVNALGGSYTTNGTSITWTCSNNVAVGDLVVVYCATAPVTQSSTTYGFTGSFNNYKWTGQNTENNVATGLVAFPASGTVTGIHFYAAGANGDSTIYTGCIWDAYGNLIAEGGQTGVGAGSMSIGGQAWVYQGLNLHIASGAGVRFGFWRWPASGHDGVWSMFGSGNFYTATTSGSGAASGIGSWPNAYGGTIGIYVDYIPDSSTPLPATLVDSSGNSYGWSAGCTGVVDANIGTAVATTSLVGGTTTFTFTTNSAGQLVAVAEAWKGTLNTVDASGQYNNGGPNTSFDCIITTSHQPDLLLALIAGHYGAGQTLSGFNSPSGSAGWSQNAGVANGTSPSAFGCGVNTANNGIGTNNLTTTTGTFQCSGNLSNYTQWSVCMVAIKVQGFTGAVKNAQARYGIGLGHTVDNQQARYVIGASPIAFLSDTFLNQALNTDLWTATTPTGTVEETLGLTITHDPAPGYNYIQSNISFNLQGGRVFMQVVSAGNQTIPSHDLRLMFLVDSTHYVYVAAIDGALVVEKDIGGTLTQIATTPYVPAAQTWWSLRELSGNLIVETASARGPLLGLGPGVDGLVWTQVASFADPLASTVGFVRIQCGCANPEAAGSFGMVQNLNIGAWPS